MPRAPVQLWTHTHSLVQRASAHISSEDVSLPQGKYSYEQESEPPALREPTFSWGQTENKHTHKQKNPARYDECHMENDNNVVC